VIGQEWQNDTRIVLFVTLADGIELTDELQEKIRKTIRSANSPRHVPARIIAVTEIPHTINGKKVELAVTSIIHGRPVKNKDALANPDVLDQFADIPELQEP
jgi:acetoacetyl-CoA synthetase